MTPTHECTICGARWIVSTESWQLWSLAAGECCSAALADDAGMEILESMPIVEIDEDSDIFASMTPAEYAEEQEAQRQADAEHDERGSCAVCEHYKPDPEAGRIYFGEPNADSGWCLNPAVKSGRKDHPHVCMLSGDWCQSFERRA